MKQPRIAIVGMFLESNRYAAVVSKEKFHKTYGDNIIEDARSPSPKLLKEGQGFFEQMDAAGAWQPVPISMIIGGAGGPADDTFIREEIDKVRLALTSQLPLDGVYILNHGAMTTTEQGDPDGLLYETVKDAVDASIPIVTTIDLHANISQRMVDNANVIVAYRTDPHIDQFECGKEAADILLEILAGMQPVVRNIRVPIVPPNVSLLTDNGPYGDLIDYGQSKIDQEILNVSIVAGFAYGDTADNGLHIIVTSRNNAEAAQALCLQLAEMAWAMKERFLWDLVPIEQAVASAVASGIDHSTQPILLADLGDNIGAGGPGNTLWLIESLHQAGAQGVFIGSFFDPTLVALASDIGIGANFTAVFHGDTWERSDATFVAENAVVKYLHPGKFNITSGPLKGMLVNAGPMCLLDLGGIVVLVTSRRPIVWPDPALIESMGIGISSIRTLVLKCRSNYRAVFNAYFDTDRMIEVDTPGRTSPVLSRHDWTRIPRPSYPIDLEFDWQPSTGKLTL
jgi:microcystin degradation protein MlrC